MKSRLLLRLGRAYNHSHLEVTFNPKSWLVGVAWTAYSFPAGMWTAHLYLPMLDVEVQYRNERIDPWENQ